jgi:TP901 family phage tail tape measure protein
VTAPSLGTIKGTIKIDYDSAGIAKANNDLDGLGKTADKTKLSGDKLAKGFLLAGGVIAGGFAVAVKSAANFEQKMSDVKAVSGATTGEMETLRRKALQLGKDTQFSASEAADAIGELAKAGVSVTDILNGAADATVALAAAGGIDLPEAATLAANAMNGFGLTAKQLPRVADLIAGAANASAIDVSEFGLSLQQVAAVAHLAGLSFDDTATAIALLGNAGIKGSDAGTSLKTVFQNLIPTTQQQIELSKKLGLITKDGANAFFDASGKAKSLSQISQVLQTALKGMSKEQQLATLQTLFGSDAIRAAAILADNGAAGFDKMATAMGKVKAADVAATKMDNLKGSIEQMKGSLETAAIQVGTALLPELKRLVDTVTSLTNWFSNLSPKTQGIILDVLGAAAAFALLTGAVIKFVKLVKTIQEVTALLRAWTIWTKIAAAATKVWTAAQWLLNIAMDANPVVLIVLAVIALIAIIVILWLKCAAFRNFFIKVWGAIWSFLKTVGAWFAGPFANFFVALWRRVVTVFNAIWAVVSRVLNFFAPLFRAVFGAIIAIIKTWWSVFSAIWTVVFTVLKAILTPFIKNLIAGWQLAFKLIVAAIRIWWGIFSTFWKAVYNFIAPLVQRLVNLVLAWWKWVFDHVITLFLAWWSVFSTFWTNVWHVVSSTVSKQWDFIVAVIRKAVDFVSGIINTFTTILNKVKSFFDGLKKAAGGGVESLIKYVADIPARIVRALANLGSALFGKGQDLIQGFINGIGTMAGKIRDVLVGLLPGPLKKFASVIGLASPSKLFRKWGVYTVMGFINGVASMQQRLKAAIATVGAFVTSPVVVTGSATTGASGVNSAAAAAAGRSTTTNNNAGPTYVTLNVDGKELGRAAVLDPKKTSEAAQEGDKKRGWAATSTRVAPAS